MTVRESEMELRERVKIERQKKCQQKSHAYHKSENGMTVGREREREISFWGYGRGLFLFLSSSNRKRKHGIGA